MGKQSYKEREKHRREEEILATAERLLNERGYSNLSMDDLAEVVGISKPTLYQHFKSKEELAAEVFIRNFRVTADFLAEPVTGRAVDRIVEFIRWSISRRHSTGYMTGLRPDLLINVMRNKPEAEQCKSQMHAHLVKLIEQAQSEGDIVSDVPTVLLTHMVFSLTWAMHSPALQAEVAGDPAALQVIIDHLIQIFLHGVTPPSIGYSQRN